ncbi:hypothetical protein HZH68_010049 [Vespula germanica]|uniref:Uncharacterized protein n=1 Tax=Vespula germanica TaxID=30212 RepID=A0A834JZQ7_VESGE|nr:hypothetical protein HZH68_010049 [Vespula germanica]
MERVRRRRDACVAEHLLWAPQSWLAWALGNIADVEESRSSKVKSKGRRKDVVDNRSIKMGCELSKLTAAKSRNQNAREGSPPPPQTTTDPRLPLTARQKFTVMASWRAVGRALEPTGVYMFIRASIEKRKIKEKENETGRVFPLESANEALLSNHLSPYEDKAKRRAERNRRCSQRDLFHSSFPISLARSQSPYRQTSFTETHDDLTIGESQWRPPCCCAFANNGAGAPSL